MAEEQKKTFQLQRVYLKDSSFECPGAPDIFLQEWKPKMNVQLNNITFLHICKFQHEFQ